MCRDVAQQERPKKEVERNIQEAIAFHLEELREEGSEIPEPSSYSSYVEVAA
jgi:predicted RNase H-like HicB family nuclease